MKKIGLILMVAFLVIGTSTAFAVPMVETFYTDYFFLGDFHTYDYASQVDFFRCVGDSWLGGIWLGNNQSLSWQHALPADLGPVPPAEVSSAKLWIDGAFINTDDNTIEIEGIGTWDHLNQTWWWTFHELPNTTYILTDINWNNLPIDVTVTCHEGNGIRLDESIMMMDYTPVSEPGTLVLLGSGLLGLGAFRFRRKK